LICRNFIMFITFGIQLQEKNLSKKIKNARIILLRLEAFLTIRISMLIFKMMTSLSQHL